MNGKSDRALVWPVRMPFVRGILIVLTVMIITACNPFGIDQFETRIADRLFNRIFSHYYECDGLQCPPSSAWFPSNRTLAKQNITVVLITPKTLEKLGVDGLLPYNTWDKLLTAIYQHEPAGVFVDVMFEARNNPANYEGRDDFINTITRARTDQGINTYLAVDRNNTIFPGAKALDRDYEVEVSHFASSMAYPLNIGYRASPALQLYLDFCRANEPAAAATARITYGSAVDGQRCGESRNTDWALDPNAQTVMRLLWGRKVEAAWEPQAFGEVACDPQLQSPTVGALGSLMTDLSQGFWPGNDDQGRTHCQYNTTVDAYDYISNPGQLGPYTKGKNILVGVSHKIGGDKVDSPVHGIVSGVSYHAMALDNLLSMGSNVFTQPTGQILGALNIETLIRLAIGLAVPGFIILWSEKIPGQTPERRTCRQCISNAHYCWTWPFVTALSVFGFYLLLAFKCRWVLTGWLQLFFVSLFWWITELLGPWLAATHKQRLLEADRWEPATWFLYGAAYIITPRSVKNLPVGNQRPTDIDPGEGNPNPARVLMEDPKNENI